MLTAENLVFLQADFMKIPQPDNTYDAVYEIEATCHAPEPVGAPAPIWDTTGGAACYIHTYNQHALQRKSYKPDATLLPLLRLLAYLFV